MINRPNSNATRSAVPTRRDNRGDYHHVSDWTSPAENDLVRQGNLDREPLRADQPIESEEYYPASAKRSVRIGGAEGEGSRPVRVPRKGAILYGENGRSGGFGLPQENPKPKRNRLMEMFARMDQQAAVPPRKQPDFFDQDWNQYLEKKL